MKPLPGHFEFIMDRLSAGLGVEDIAARENIPVDAVRQVVADLRAQGLLKEIYHREGV